MPRSRWPSLVERVRIVQECLRLVADLDVRVHDSISDKLCQHLWPMFAPANVQLPLEVVDLLDLLFDDLIQLQPQISL